MHDAHGARIVHCETVHAALDDNEDVSESTEGAVMNA